MAVNIPVPGIVTVEESDPRRGPIQREPKPSE